MTRRLLFLFSGCALVIAWLLPNHKLPWTAFYNDFLAAIALLGMACASCIQAGWRGSITITPSALALLITAALPLLQLLTGTITFAGDAWVASLYLSGFLLAYLVGYQSGVENSNKLFTIIASLFLLGSIVSVVLALSQWLQWANQWLWVVDLPAGERPYANLAQPNNLATLLCLGSLAALYLYEEKHLGGTVTALLLLFLFAGIAMTRSRTPFLIALIVSCWMLWARARIDLRVRLPHILAGLSVFALLWFVWPVFTEGLDLGDSPTLSARIQSSPRLAIWAQLFDAAINSPTFGYGWNQVSTAQISVAANHSPAKMVFNSHSTVLDLLLWNGVWIGGILLFALGWWMVSRLKQCPNKAVWYGLAAILAVATHGLLEYPLDYAYFLLPIGLFAGAVDSSYPQRQLRIPIAAFAGLVLSASITLAWIFIEYQSLEYQYWRMRFEKMYPSTKTAHYDASKIIILNQLSELIRFARSEARENMNEEELEWMRRVAHRYPYPPALFRYALALGLNHRYEQSALELSRLTKLNTPIQVAETEQGWHALRTRYPQLANVTFPTQRQSPESLEAAP